MSYREVTQCRACQGSDLTQVFDLGNQPLANNFCLPTEARQGFYPLRILYCGTCGLAQLSAVVDRDTIYRNYAYVSSSSATMQRHYDRLFKDIESERVNHSIIEIGSNNGGCLKFAKTCGFEVLGIDPAYNLAEMANASGIPTIADFFDHKTAKAASEIVPDPGVILARHVFAHVGDWYDFMSALDVMAGEHTMVCIEVPYAVDMLRGVEFDTAYHEHLSYVTLRPIVQLLKRTAFRLHRINRYAIHGGALLLMLRRKSCGLTPHLSVEEMLSEEKVTVKDWKEFDLRAHEKISKLREIVVPMAECGKVISAFGASAKATVLLNACQFSKKHVQFVTDNTPLKPGKLVPGTDIPVIDESEMLSAHPNYSILTCWNFKIEVLEKMKRWSGRGGKWIIPDKDIEIV